MATDQLDADLRAARGATRQAAAAFEAFGWVAQPTRRKSVKAVGTGEHAGRVEYGKRAAKLLAAVTAPGQVATGLTTAVRTKTLQPPADANRPDGPAAAAYAGGGGAVELGVAAALAAHKAYKAARRLDRTLGRAVLAVNSYIERLGADAAGSRVLGAALRAAGRAVNGTAVGRGVAAGVRRQLRLLSNVAHAAGRSGVTGGAARLVQKFAFRYFDAAYRMNRRVYGRPAAVVMEVASVLLNYSLKYGLTVAGMAAVGVAGATLGPAGAAAGAAAGSLLGSGFGSAAAALARAGLEGAGGVGTASAAKQLGRVAVNVAARKVAARVRGDRPPSAAKARKLSGGLMGRGRNRAVLDLARGVTVFPNQAKRTVKRLVKAKRPVPPELLRISRMAEAVADAITARPDQSAILAAVAAQARGAGSAAGQKLRAATPAEVLAAVLSAARLLADAPPQAGVSP